MSFFRKNRYEVYIIFCVILGGLLIVWGGFVNIFIILGSPTKKLSANRNNNYHFSNLFINSVPIHHFIIYHSTKIFLSFYNKEENIIN